MTTSYSDKDTAISIAKEKSLNSNIFYVIFSQGKYYVDDNGLVRNWETLIAIYENGKEVI